MNAHVGDLHTTLPTPEKERAPDQIADLLLTPIHEQRRVSGTMPSPPSSLPVVCDLDIQVEVHVKRLSQVKMTLESMFMKNISAVIEDTQHPVHVRGVPIMKNHSFLVG